ncbi:hypothetical protein [Marinobacter sp.]|uniref:hypothetical protein n=1 Tax=Marinobacter sp. TaxID=50741 RepID=UPI0035C74EE8
MAKGEIVEHIGDGQYRVSLKYGTERIQQELEQIDERIAELAVIVPQKKLALLQADAAVDDVADAIDSLIPDYQAGVNGAADQIRLLQIDLMELQGERAKANRAAKDAIAEDLALKKRRTQIERVPTEKEITAWCADFVTDATGEVGLIEVNDESDNNLIIHPSFDGSGKYNPSRDGQLVPRAAQTGAQLWFNAAILPAVQKWQPGYRVGTITRIEGETCNLSLDPAQSSEQGLDINQTLVLEKVPVQYMDCDVVAFELGDRVLVRWFQSGPQVIGFESNPKPCTQSGFYFLPTLALGNNSFTQYGEPFLDGAGTEINPPLGTEGGINPAWTLVPAFREEPYTIAKGIENYLTGNRNYLGPTPELIVSWDGPPSRFFDPKNEVNLGTGWRSSWVRGSVVYHKLNVLVDLGDYTETDGFQKVAGAAIRRVSGGLELLVMGKTPQSQGEAYKLFKFNLAQDKTVNGLPDVGPEIDLADDLAGVTDWYFNHDANRAVLTVRHYATELEPDPDGSRVYLYEWSEVGGFTSQLIYDKDAEPRPYRVDQVNEYLMKDPGVVGLTRKYTRDATNQGASDEVDIPIYVEYVGNQKVTAYHRIPAKTFGTSLQYDQSFYDQEYPHPCAGEPIPNGGGATYPATFVDEGDQDQTIDYVISEGSSSFERIVDSNGVTLAEIPVIEYNNRTSNTFQHNRNVSLELACGSLIIEENNYTVTLSQEEVWRSDLGRFDEFSIDLRSRFVVAGYEVSTLRREGVRTGQNTGDDIQFDPGAPPFDPGYLEVTCSLAETRVQKFVSVFLNGTLKKSVQLEDTTDALSPQFRLQGDAVVIPGTDLDSQISSGTITDQEGPTTIYFSYPTATTMIAGLRLADCAAVTIGNRTAVSTLLVSNLYPMFSYQTLDELGDVVTELFQRPADSLYSMHRLSAF